MRGYLKVKITAVFCVYNEEEYLTYAVKAILPAVDEVLICLGLAPYSAYNPQAREISKTDRTEELVDALEKTSPKIKVIKGIWNSEVEHRNAGLQRCLENGSDYYWLIDGDEIYRADHIQNIRQEILKHPKAGTFIIKCHIFWRSFRYRITAQELSWRPRRIFKMTRYRRILGLKFPYPLRFIGQNEMNSVGPVYEISTEQAVFYHFSYARSAQAMEDKFKTFSHAHEIKGDWIQSVWKQWPQNRTMQNIHPIDPPKFPRAIEKTPEDMPQIMQTHPFYALDIIP